MAHKGYTINYFIQKIRTAPQSIKSEKDIIDIISPRAGKGSQAHIMLDDYLDYYLNEIVDTTSYIYKKLKGKTLKAKLINALKLRKKYGVFIPYFM